MGASKSCKKLENIEGTTKRDKKGRILRGSIINPKGRTIGSLSLINLLKKRLLEIPEKAKKYIYADLVIRKLVKKAIAGDMSALKEVFNRVEGTPKESLDLTSGGEKIVENYEVDNSEIRNLISQFGKELKKALSNKQ